MKRNGKEYRRKALLMHPELEDIRMHLLQDRYSWQQIADIYDVSKSSIQRLSIKMKEEIPMVTQERAYTSPIWYTPE